MEVRSVPWRPRDAWVVYLWPFVVVFAIALEAYVIYSLTPGWSGWGPLRQWTNTDTPQANFAYYVLDIIVSYSVLAFYLRKYRLRLSSLGLRRFRFWKAVGYVLAIYVTFTLLILVLFGLIQWLAPHVVDLNQAQDTGFKQQSTLALLATVILPPLVEEPTFRGFIFPAFSKKRGAVFGAIMSSLLFGLAHGQANVGIYTFVLGLLLCWLYTRTNSIIPGMLVHMLNNLVAYSVSLK